MKLKSNNYKPSSIKLYFFSAIIFISIAWILFSIDFKRLAQTEVENFQTKFTTFSYLQQLLDNGERKTISYLNFENLKNLSNKLSSIFLDGILDENISPDGEIKIFIKFKHLERIYSDRSQAIIKGINKEPKEVPCKISDGVNTYKCKVSLKGDLIGHWNAKTRMSLRVRVKDGFIYNMKDFSIQKPSQRQFPYDQVFHQISNELGSLSSNQQKFFNISVNGESWGIMNAEPTIDLKYLESNDVKRIGVFRISNQDSWAYKLEENYYDGYFLSDPSINIGIRGNDAKILQDENFLEIYSYIFKMMSTGRGDLFDREDMISNLILALVWGNIHTLYDNNAWYTWNPYKQKLEPILTDQMAWRDISDNLDELKTLPYAYKIIFKNQPLLESEYKNHIQKLANYFEKNNPIELANYLKDKYFKNDQLFTTTPIFKNIEFLKSKTSEIVSSINSISNPFQALEVQNNIQIEQLDDIENFVKIVHFRDGTIKIYNLLDQNITIKSIRTSSKSIDINKVLSKSMKDNLSYITIKTNFIGDYSQSLFVNTYFDNYTKITLNDFSLLNIDINKNQSLNSNLYICDSISKEGKCIISDNKDINENIVIDNNAEIREGVVIKINGNSDIIFKSGVSMIGTEKKPIKFQANGAGGIYIENKYNFNSVIENTVFTNLGTTSSALRKYTGSINGYGGYFDIKNVTIKDGKSEDQLNIIHADININNLSIHNSPSDAFDCDFCKGSIKNIYFNNIGGDGLDVSGSQLSVDNFKGENINDKFLSVGERSDISLNQAFVKNVGTAVAVKDSSRAIINNISMENIKYDLFMTYIKKPFYIGSTSLEVKNFKHDNFHEGFDCVREQNTYLKLNNIDCEISNIDVDSLYQGRMKK